MRHTLLLICAMLASGCASKPKPESAAATVPPDLPKTPEEWRAHIEKVVAAGVQFVRHQKDAALHQTDHQALLAGCREVIRARKQYPRDPKWHGPHADRARSLISPDHPKLPKVIRDLEAVYLFAYDDCVMIELHGGHHHHGFIAYREGASEHPGTDRGSQKLIDGLWFYEDAY